MTESKAQVFASHLMAHLVAGGVDHIFMAPGARSQALAIAAGQLAHDQHAGLHVRIDERSLGFQALGVGLSSGFPAAVVVTSGTAVANLHPAVLEAHHAGIPMLLLTADRPKELRGVGANQTTKQVGIFAEAVVACLDIPAPSLEDSDEYLQEQARELAEEVIRLSISAPGPVQLNLGFREPLSASWPNASMVFDSIIEHRAETQTLTTGIPLVHEPARVDADGFGIPDTVIDVGKRTVVIAGDAGDLARWYCTGLPVFAEPSSGVRGLAESVPGYLLLLEQSHELTSQIEQVLVFGKPTLSRAVQALLKRPELTVYTDPGRHGIFNPGGNAQLLGENVDFLGDPDQGWLLAWQEAGERALAAAKDSLPVTDGVDRRHLIESVFSSADHINPLVIGASRLIREADVWAPKRDLQVFSNRGLSGIDGTIATAVGVALTQPQAWVRVLLGDITFLHDASSLALDPTDDGLNLQVVIGNDGGGSIFETLEVAQELDPATFDRLFRTPQLTDIRLLARAFGWQYIPVQTQNQLELALQHHGRVVIDVRLNQPSA